MRISNAENMRKFASMLVQAKASNNTKVSRYCKEQLDIAERRAGAKSLKRWIA